MSRQQQPRFSGEDYVFSRQLLPLNAVVLEGIVDEAALPPWHSLMEIGCAEASRAFHLACQSVDIIALTGPAISAPLADRRRLSLLYVESGELELLHPEHACFCSAGTWVLVPACSLIWKSSSFSVICILVSPEEILLHLQTTCFEAGENERSVLPPWPHSFPSNRQDVDGLVLEMLTDLLHSASQLHRLEPALLERLEIGNQVLRFMAVLIDPDIRSSQATDVSQQALSQGREDFDALIGYIRANLDQPLNLTVLANQSHYSRRSLQYAFRNLLGCTATQWIRSQRLDLAWQLLQDARPGDTVTRIAQSCGYRSLSLFSIEFQHRFHIKPSVLLRNTRYGRGVQNPQLPDGENLR